TVDEIHDIVNRFRDAAWRAMEAGFEVIEIHAAHGYLLSEFLDPLVNDRDDEYGGSLENRIRIVIEVADAIRY
ncbi:2,4-dienoyl-CoA reductase, partial [Erysipelatoclostridium ramosum]|nr:2,4-dienoyl-CoA reductase [Thomasclavelia ramosa]